MCGGRIRRGAGAHENHVHGERDRPAIDFKYDVGARVRIELTRDVIGITRFPAQDRAISHADALIVGERASLEA